MEQNKSDEQKDDGKKERKGDTIITSVSVTSRFKELMIQHGMSPTECLRRGIAVTLYDLGVAVYQSERNKERSDYMHKYLNEVKQDEKYENLEKDYQKLKKMLEDFKELREKTKELLSKWDDEEIKKEENGDNRECVI